MSNRLGKNGADLVRQLDLARDRLDQIERLSRWAIDLRARVWREQQVFMLVGVDHDFGPLAVEVEQFKRVKKAIAWRPRW
jgi:hypothetical protein